MEPKHGFRQLNVGDAVWQFRVGKNSVVIFDPAGRRYCPSHAEITGLSQDSVERMRWKNRGSDHEANVRPSTVAEWISRLSRER